MSDTTGTRMRKAGWAAAAILGAGLVLTGGLAAQQPSQPKTGAPAKQQAKRPPPDSAASTSDAGVRQRVEQLEEQLVDMQVVIGTLESMGRGGPSTASAAFRGGAPIGGGLSGPEAGRIAALETQVQALTAQLEQMSDQLRALQSGGAPAPRGQLGPSPRTAAPPAGGGFGAARVIPPNDPIASIIDRDDRRGPAPGAAVAAAPQGSMPSSPVSRQQYDAAYRSLLQQDYTTAEAGFGEFLRRYPNDELTPSAQFWLGETHFVRGQWDSAAAAFLKVAQTHPRSDKAPDSLAKFAMAMERKGNRPAACRALQELNARYPNPPAHVKTWEAAERRRAGCA